VLPELIVPEHMVLVKGGTFEMGDKPTHTVTLDDFFMAKHPLTFAEYDAFCKATGRELSSDIGWGRGNRPVIKVNWFDAVEYCNWRSEQEKLKQVYTLSQEAVTADWNANGYRLPTEAEWEYAAKGGGYSQGFMYAGSNHAYEVAWYKANSDGKTQPVGQKKANELGLYDLSGNVWEWCWDWYDEKYDNNSPGENPRGPNTGSYRVMRGGSWFIDPFLCRASNRGRYLPDSRVNYLGFRLARH